MRYRGLEAKKIVCLHAGNLPLVGIQDLLAVVLTGGSYAGKISRKDPYLLPTLLNELQKTGVLNDAKWSDDLEKLKFVNGDAVLFAGSESSVDVVNQKLEALEILKPGAPRLMRTAHFSVAWIEDNKPETMENLTEAVFRYGGTGCRSAALVVAPFHLDSEKCAFTDYIELFWIRNPQMHKPPAELFHRYAYNKAVGIPQAWLDDFLIEESAACPEHPYLLHWVKGDRKDLANLVHRFGNGIQSVYSSNDSDEGRKIGPFRYERLSRAQSPPIWWEPDGTDTIQWLQTTLSA